MYVPSEVDLDTIDVKSSNTNFTINSISINKLFSNNGDINVDFK
ncbi:hypothetical protein [uncultured Clostridium sp.]|nr:hypothetical protein [uncultured Clostridium sp.]